MAKEACVYPLLGVSPRSSLRAGKGGGQLRGSELDCKGAQAGARGRHQGGCLRESTVAVWLGPWHDAHELHNDLLLYRSF